MNSIYPYLNPITLVFVVAAAVLALWVGNRLLKRSIDLDGPPNPSWISGTGLESDEKYMDLHESFMRGYGRTVKTYGPLGTQGIYTSDPSAIHSITTKDMAHYGRASVSVMPALTLAGPWLPFVVVFENFGSARFRRWIAKTAPFKVIQDLRELVNVQHRQAQEILSARQGLLGSGENLDNTTGSGNDILTLLMRANERLPKDSQMSREEMIGHMNSFIFAGHETTSGAVTRVLDILSTHPDVQDRLRAELIEFMSKPGTGEDIDVDKIDTLPYLDVVCREVLRLAPPAGMIRRVCLEDTILPLKYPVNTSKGLQNSVVVPKGAEVNIGIEGIN
ncbi:cytochrome P450-dit2 [Ceratobasidium sp. 370]|nr:cytochrome P450-dit2 [Ceratobasidium sp. 370]